MKFCVNLYETPGGGRNIIQKKVKRLVSTVGAWIIINRAVFFPPIYVARRFEETKLPPLALKKKVCLLHIFLITVFINSNESNFSSRRDTWHFNCPHQNTFAATLNELNQLTHAELTHLNLA